MSVILVGGGSRSGKSSYAQGEALVRARADDCQPVYIATALPDDDPEMADRIWRHRNDRGDAFTLIEAPLELAPALAGADRAVPVVVDCITVWLANVLALGMEPDFEPLIATARGRSGDTYFVTNEVGEGIVPMHPVGRRFRDQSGWMNQRMAGGADSVVFMRFGLPQRLK